MTTIERRQLELATARLMELEDELQWAKSELRAAQVRLDRVQRDYNAVSARCRQLRIWVDAEDVA